MKKNNAVWKLTCGATLVVSIFEGSMKVAFPSANQYFFREDIFLYLKLSFVLIIEITLYIL